ncbi:hypothetical protein HYC85_012125 [Camellia sinensis]|uniref:Uncharacterized protein n=1 Tax=Camellia sinensis TaxID=4442 RepID=A0A7J7HB16_CAMSI|nr:hypothetical protein HYC85_012125 [Camellia sinensis]
MEQKYNYRGGDETHSTHSSHSPISDGSLFLIVYSPLNLYLYISWGKVAGQQWHCSFFLNLLLKGSGNDVALIHEDKNAMLNFSKLSSCRAEERPTTADHGAGDDIKNYIKKQLTKYHKCELLSVFLITTGHYIEGAKLIDSVLDVVRKEADNWVVEVNRVSPTD